MKKALGPNSQKLTHLNPSPMPIRPMPFGPMPFGPIPLRPMPFQCIYKANMKFSYWNSKSFVIYKSFFWSKFTHF